MTSTVEALGERLNIGAVAVIGAGQSLGARYPTAVNLAALVWDAIDADLVARAALATRLGLADAPTKSLVGDEAERLKEAWESIASSPVARARFQHAFVELDHTRAPQPSASQEGLARLIHAGIVECVVSFNWDSALEHAYRRLYGTAVPVGVLFKPHGDVAAPDEPWLLPHEAGRVTEPVRRRIDELASQHPRTLLIIGYSESDRAVVDELIRPLDDRWRVSRIGPSVSGAEDVPGTADVVLDALAAPIAHREDQSSWHVVTFNTKRGIESAMEGRRLMPADVDSCPQLPEVGAVIQSLLWSHAVVLNGESGSGKSITSYQVARALTELGFEVLRLRDVARGNGVPAWLSDLQLFPHKKLLFIDDAQGLTTDAVRELAESASTEQLVLVTGVDHVAGGVVTYGLSGDTAVGMLEQFVRTHRDEMLAKVQELDDRVGDGIADERFEDRLRAAAGERSAWMFFYTLTGGWRRTGRALQEARSHDRADLLACALAVAQIASVDSGVTTDDLVPYALAIGRDQDWVHQNLAVLGNSHLAVEDDGVWRCPHLRTAYSIIDWMLHPPRWVSPPMPQNVAVPAIASAQGRSARSNRAHLPQRQQTNTYLRLPEAVVRADQEQAATLIKLAIDTPSTSMRGIAWLLGRNLNSEARWVLRVHGVRSPERDRALALRALATPAGPDVGMAAQLLEQLDDPESPAIVEALWQRLDVIVSWVRGVTPEVGWALGSLINVLINDDRARISHALETVDPSAIAGLVKAGDWPYIYSSTKAIDRIAEAGGLDLIRAVGAAFDEDELDGMLNEVPSLAHADELFAMLAHLNRDLGVRLFEKHAPRLAAMFSPKPLENYHQLSETFAFLLGFLPGFLRHRVPTAAAKRAARTFLRASDPTVLIGELSRPGTDWRWHNFWEYLSMYIEADPHGWESVVAAIDMPTLEATLRDEAAYPSTNLMYVLLLLASTRGDEVRAMLEAHPDEYATMPPFLVYIHPELAVRLLQRGLPLDLGLEQHRYDTAGTQLAIIAQINPDVAREVAEANAAAFAASLASKFHPPFEKLSEWVTACDRSAPGLIDRILAGLGSGVVSAWAGAMQKPKSKREIASLIVRASALPTTPASREAAELMRRFPSLRPKS